MQARSPHCSPRCIESDRIVLAVFGEDLALPAPHAADRRVVLFASTALMSHLVDRALDDDALEVAWTKDGSVLRETRGITPVVPAP